VSSPAGWYPQPDGRQRYWDGERWTDHFAADKGATSPAELSGEGPSPSVGMIEKVAGRGRRFGPACWFGWGGLTLLVLIGALSSGLSGAAMMFGLFAFIVGVIALIRGQIGWARLPSRAAAAGVLAGSIVAFTVGAVTAPTPKPTVNSASVGVHTTTPTPISTPSSSRTPSSPAPSSSSTPASSPSASTEVVTAPTTAATIPISTAAEPAPAATTTSISPVVGVVLTADGAFMPDSSRTPGAVNPSVNQANIGQTICVTGWTASVRPPSSVTSALKAVQLASGYTYKGDTLASDYEEDHLIALESWAVPLTPRPTSGPNRITAAREPMLRTA